MDVNPDFCDLLRALNDASARYLLVGGQAFAYHAEPRFTEDMDVWVEASAENAERVWNALRQFGAPLFDLTKADLANPDMVFKIGVEPNRIDIMMGIDGATFPTAWRNRIRASYGPVPVNVIGREELIRTKRAAGRPMDLNDVQQLTKRPHRRASRRRSKLK